MYDVFIRSAPADWRNDLVRRGQILSEILSLNGKPSIHQFERICEYLRAAEDIVADPRQLLDHYQRELRAIVCERSAAIRSGKSARNEFIIWNALRLLELLRARGIRLIILSGTVEDDVRAETELLGLAGFFGPHIYGSRPQGLFSKKEIIDRILREERIEGHQLLAFGDGPVEIQLTKAVGGLAIGVASDEEENGSHKCDSAKEEQLLRAGADMVVADYVEADALVAAIFSE